MNRLRAVLIAVLAVALCATPALSSEAAPAPKAAPVRQVAKLFMHPQLAQPGIAPANANGARSAMVAYFRPIRPGRKVLLQQRVGRRWVTLSTARQNGRGEATFTAPYSIRGHIQRYRAYAVFNPGLPGVFTNAANANRWGLADFNEQFFGRYVGGRLPAQWGHRRQGFAAVHNRTCSASTPRAADVVNGTARLMVLRSAGPRPKRPWWRVCHLNGKTYTWRVNGNIGTQGRFAFKYGYAAARIKFQRNAGQHAGFWMLPAKTQGPYGARLNGAEIDTIEWYGDRRNDGNELSNFIHVRQKDGSYRKIGGLIANPAAYGRDWYSRYHVFSVEWTPDAYIFRIDGHETRRILGNVSAQPEFLVLSLLSSDWELPFAPVTQPQTTFVDWVRVWDLQR